jgi:signal transduction histidine kinase
VTDLAARPWPRIVAAFGGCLMLAVANSGRFIGTISPFVTLPYVSSTGRSSAPSEQILELLAATVMALCLIRFWPYLIVAGGLFLAPGVAVELGVRISGGPHLYYLQVAVAVPLILVGVLAAAQSLVRDGRTGWGAAVAGAALGGQMVGMALLGTPWLTGIPPLRNAHVTLTAVGIAAALLGVVLHAKGDPAAESGGWGWSRVRLLVAGGVAATAGFLPGLLTQRRIADLLDVTPYALFRHAYVVPAVIGAGVLLVGVLAAALSGTWAAGGALTAAGLQVAIAAPMILAVYALTFNDPLRWSAAAVGVVLGAGAAASRWRVPLAAGGAVLSAAALFIAFAATTGTPEKLITQQRNIPGALLLVGLSFTATALIGGVASVLGRRAVLPAVLGPVVATLTLGGTLVIQVTYVGPNGLPESSYLNPVHHITTAATLLLVAAAALVGLHAADSVATRRTERRVAEAIRRQAAAAERERLARPIHDGVLQVLALVERYGPELGDQGARLAELASAQNASLRTLIASEAADGSGLDPTDLRTHLTGLATAAVHIAVPAEPVVLPAHHVRELAAAVAAALDNVHRHAGPSARAWVLLEDERDAVRVSVRDDGPGIAEGRLGEAAAAGRLGVAQSIRGRVNDLGGTVDIASRPGDGTEVEIRIPRPTGR